MTENVKVARAIFDEVKGFRNQEFVRSYKIAVSMKAVRSNLYFFMRQEGLDFKLVVDGDTLWVRSKPQTRQQRLETMIRKLAMHVEDEKLYEEALALIGYV